MHPVTVNALRDFHISTRQTFSRMLCKKMEQGLVKNRDPLMGAGSLKNMGSKWMAALPFSVHES